MVVHRTYIKIFETLLRLSKPKSIQLIPIVQIYEMFAPATFLFITFYNLIICQLNINNYKKNPRLLLFTFCVLLLLLSSFFHHHHHRFMSHEMQQCEKLKYYRHYFNFDLETWRVLLWVTRWLKLLFLRGNCFCI